LCDNQRPRVAYLIGDDTFVDDGSSGRRGGKDKLGMGEHGSQCVCCWSLGSVGPGRGMAWMYRGLQQCWSKPLGARAAAMENDEGVPVAAHGVDDQWVGKCRPGRHDANNKLSVMGAFGRLFGALCAEPSRIRPQGASISEISHSRDQLWTRVGLTVLWYS